MALQRKQDAASINSTQNDKKLTTSDRLELVLKTQGQRARSYREMRDTFISLLNKELDDEKYVEKVQGIMIEFQSISNTMRGIAAQFEQRNLRKLSKFVGNLQRLEKQKLTITMDMQQKILAARPDDDGHSEHHCSGHGHNENKIIWRPRLYKEKQQHAAVIEEINDLLAEIKEVRDSLKMTQQIVIQGTSVQIKTSDDCKTHDIKHTK